MSVATLQGVSLFDWSDRQVGAYLHEHDLPYHPLWEKGFISIGDWHATRSLAQAGNIDKVRFFGLRRECGLHEPASSIEIQGLIENPLVALSTLTCTESVCVSRVQIHWSFRANSVQ